MKLNIATKMTIGASLCALAFSANAGNACALAKNTITTDASNGEWIGLYCMQKKKQASCDDHKSNAVWFVIPAGQVSAKADEQNCQASTNVFDANCVAVGGTLKNLYNEYQVISSTVVDGVCPGVYTDPDA
jgi:hypothetical protein